MSNEQKSFIESVAGGAWEGMVRHGILASVTIAQAILESGWGKSGLTKASNNLFGIKATNSWRGEKIQYKTKEYVNGKYIDTYAWFRSYLTMDDSMVDHGAFLAGLSRYANIIGDTDYKSVCRKLRQDGYATAPDYAEKLIGIIESYGLTAYDKPAVKLHKFYAVVSNGDLKRFEALAEELELKIYGKDEYYGNY